MQRQGFEHLALVARLFVQQADFQQVVNPPEHLLRVERFADEILGAAFQRAQPVDGIDGNGQYREIASRFQFDLLEALHDLKTIQPGHLEIKQNQGIAILAMQLAYVTRVARECDGRVPGETQHLSEQLEAFFMIVDQKNAGVEDVRGTHHRRRPVNIAERRRAASYYVSWRTYSAK